MKLVFFALAENAIVDQKTNKLSVINILDNSITEGFPFLIPNLTAASILEKEALDEQNMHANLKIKFYDIVMGEAVIDYNFIDGSPRTRNMASISGLMIPSPGTLTAVLENTDGTEITTYCIEFQSRIMVR